MPCHILELFLEWLEHRNVQVICCSDQGQPPPITGEMPHEWLLRKVDYYEEFEIDIRVKDPVLIELKKNVSISNLIRFNAGR